LLAGSAQKEYARDCVAEEAAAAAASAVARDTTIDGLAALLLASALLMLWGEKKNLSDADLILLFLFYTY